MTKLMWLTKTTDHRIMNTIRCSQQALYSSSQRVVLYIILCKCSGPSVSVAGHSFVFVQVIFGMQEHTPAWRHSPRVSCLWTTNDARVCYSSPARHSTAQHSSCCNWKATGNFQCFRPQFLVMYLVSFAAVLVVIVVALVLIVVWTVLHHSFLSCDMVTTYKQGHTCTCQNMHPHINMQLQCSFKFMAAS